MSNIPIPDNPEFNSNMIALETTTPAYAPTFNAMFQQLLCNEVALKNNAKKISDDNTGDVYTMGVENGLLYIDDGKSEDA